VGAVTPKSIRTSFKGGKLTGTKIAVVDGADADYAVVLARASPTNRANAALRSRWSI
jgi:alkylation response protein AidB-like acyl-CoA dehydrogenase